MRIISITTAALLAMLCQGRAWAQDVGADLAFMETCRAERNCVCDSLDDWFACIADAPALAARGEFDVTALVNSIATEADRHLARECASEQGSRHRLCNATVAIRELATSAADFLAADLHGEPQLDAPNDEWRQFLDGLLITPGGEIGGEIGPGGIRPAGDGGFGGVLPPASGLGDEGPLPNQFGREQPRVPAGDAMRRGGSPQTAQNIPANAAATMCGRMNTSGGDPTWAGCIPGVCSCPERPTVNLVVGGNTIEVSPTSICSTIGYGLGDLLDLAARANGGATAMLSILGMAASVLDAIAANAAPILCGYARNSTYISDDCINNYSGAECQGARLALECLGCGNTGVRECSARCICFWQALANYNQDRRRREGWWCRNFGLRCPDDRGYFYRLGVSCLNPPPGGIRRGGYR